MSRTFPTIMNKANTSLDDVIPMIGFHAVKISNDSNVAELKVEGTGEWAWLPVPPEGVSTAYPQGWDESTASAMGSGISQLYSKFFETAGTATASPNNRGNSNLDSVGGVAGTAIDVGIEKAKGALGAGAGINQRFSLKPESKTDAKNIAEIVQFFKFYSAPRLDRQTGGLVRLYDTPHLFDILIAPETLQKNMFMFKSSALTDIQVKYGGEKFNVTTDDNPTSVDISLNFKEMSILSQIDVTRGGGSSH